MKAILRYKNWILAGLTGRFDTFSHEIVEAS